MIDEAIPTRLFEALWRELPADQAARIAHDAGKRTGEYVLANRIPGFAKSILRALPPALATPMLLKAINRNAWTFAGSGVFNLVSIKPAIVTIAHNPLAMPGCVWHVGVFERLFRALVSETTIVRHTDCRLSGATACRFEIDVRAG